jgi:hypothetical protein
MNRAPLEAKTFVVRAGEHIIFRWHRELDDRV